MSGSKRLMEEIEGQHEWCVQLLLDAGALAECDDHGYRVDEMDSAAFEDAVAAGMRISGESKRLMRQRLQDALDRYGDSCPGCDSNAAQ
jgi:hypothetical protein